MSKHTQGRIKAIRWVDGLSALRPEESSGRHFGGASVVDMIGGSMSHDDARRLAAAWNACEGMTTENLESIVFVGETIRIRFDFINAELRQAQAEINAARALLRDVSNDGQLDMGNTNTAALSDRVRSYLDKCDTLEGNKPIEASGCRKCGDILPDGDYCKAPACPLNPSMKGES